MIAKIKFLAGSLILKPKQPFLISTVHSICDVIITDVVLLRLAYVSCKRELTSVEEEHVSPLQLLVLVETNTLPYVQPVVPVDVAGGTATLCVLHQSLFFTRYHSTIPIGAQLLACAE